MPETLNIPATNAPVSSAFLGLESYTEKDAPFFFGRENEIKDLYQLVKYNTLTLLFGKSGTGKTSLLNAGVFPRLRNDDCLPFRIRLVFNEDSPALLAQVWAVLKSQVDAYSFRIQTYIEGETLWEFFHREDLWKVVTPILVFDQLEEIFTIAGKYPGRKEELESLVIELADLIENIVPVKVKACYLNGNKRIEYEYKKQRVKVIFAFREDFLAEMEGVTSRIPSVKNARFRLMPMNGTKAYEVITKTWKAAIDPAEADKIVTYLVHDQEDDTTNLQNLHSRLDVLEIEPALLSQVCASLDKERVKENLEKISADFLKKYPKENILSSIYHNALRESLAAEDKAAPGRAKEKALLVAEQSAEKFIEDNLVNEKGFREKFVSKDIPEEMMPAVNGLKARFFIRQDGIFIELTHDVIAVIVKKEKDIRLKADASKAALKKGLMIVAAAILISLVVFGITAKKIDDTIKEKRGEITKVETKIKSLNVTFRKKETNILNGLVESSDTIYRQGDSIYIRIPADTIRLDGKENEATKDSLVIEINKLKNQLNDLESLISLYKETIVAKDLEIAKSKGSLEEAGNKNQMLQNEIARLNTEIKRLEGLSLDVSYFNIYQTHLDSLMMYKNNAPLQVQQRLNALQINWEPFREKTEQLQKKK